MGLWTARSRNCCSTTRLISCVTLSLWWSAGLSFPVPSWRLAACQIDHPNAWHGPSCKPPRQPARCSRGSCTRGWSTPADNTNPTASLTKQHGYCGSLVAFSFQKQSFLFDVGAKHNRRPIKTQGFAWKRSHVAKRKVERNQNGTYCFQMWAWNN